jgi:uncharacterized membrane protein
MMSGRNGGVGGLPAVGGVLGMLGVLGGGLYWLGNQNSPRSATDDSARKTLQNRYARGEIDEEEYRRRRERLDATDEDFSN